MRCASPLLPLLGANITGLIPGFNTTILERLPRSMLLIEVESILMGFAFLAMIIVRTKRKQRTAACVCVCVCVSAKEARRRCNPKHLKLRFAVLSFCTFARTS